MHIIADPYMFAVDPDIPRLHHAVAWTQRLQLRRDEVIAVPALDMMNKPFYKIWSVVLDHLIKPCMKIDSISAFSSEPCFKYGSCNFSLIRFMVDALEALHGRVSSARLSGEVGETELDNIFRAALRAPDHAQLRPWRFLTVSGEARQKLGALYARAKLTEDPSTGSADLEKIKSKPLRAPLIVVAIVCITEHPKVPEVEQILSTGAAMQNMLLAAYAQGVGAMWRTGAMAYNRVVCDGLGLAGNEKIVGFLYLGEAEGNLKSARPLNVADYVKAWTAS